MFEYYFSKGFTYFDCSIINFFKLPIEVKVRIHAEDTDNSDKFMICSTTIPSTSNTLNNLAVNTSFYYYYIQKQFNDRKEQIINISSAYVELLIKDIDYPVFLQEWKLNLDASEYERNIDANLYKPSRKKKFNCHNSDKYWPIPIKYTIQWFPLITIMEHNANIMCTNNGLILLLLKVFSMFELRLNFDREKLDIISIRCINCKREIGLYLKNTTFY